MRSPNCMGHCGDHPVQEASKRGHRISDQIYINVILSRCLKYVAFEQSFKE